MELLAPKFATLSLLGFCAVVCTVGAGPNVAAPLPASYSVVEVDPFVAAPGVAFPADYQNALVEDVAREISVRFETVLIVHQGEPAPDNQPMLRISGRVIEFQPGSKTKRALLGFGAGAASVKAQVTLSDAARRQLLFSLEFTGTAWTGADANSKGAAESLAKKIAKFCIAKHLVGSS